MWMLYYRFFCLFVLVLTIETATASSKKQSEPGVTHRDNSYSFGVVPQFAQRKSFKIWQPILLELEKRTGLHFVLKGSSIIPAFEEQFMSGGFDFAYMNPYHFALASSRQGYIALVRDGGRSLNGVLLVRRDSPIQSVDQLSGKVIAFPAPNALGASLLIRNELQNNYNISFIPKYVQTHSSVYLHVLKHLVDAGGGVVQTLNSQKPSIRNNLRIIFQTRSISPHPITVHPRVPVEHRELVKRAFLDMAQSESGKKLLAKIPIKKAIATSIADYRNILSWKLEALYVP